MLGLLFGFQGRVGRTEWWLVRLGVLFLAFFIFMVEMMIIEGVAGRDGIVPSTPTGILSIVTFYALFLIVVWVNLAIGVKRWHDRGKSGFWIFLGLVPLIGPIWTLIECGFLPGTEERNKYDIDLADTAEAFT